MNVCNGGSAAQRVFGAATSPNGINSRPVRTSTVRTVLPVRMGPNFLLYVLPMEGVGDSLLHAKLCRYVARCVPACPYGRPFVLFYRISMPPYILVILFGLSRS